MDRLAWLRRGVVVLVGVPVVALLTTFVASLVPDRLILDSLIDGVARQEILNIPQVGISGRGLDVFSDCIALTMGLGETDGGPLTIGVRNPTLGSCEGAVASLQAYELGVDIGCGSGEIGSELAAAGRSVVGVEVLARDGCAIPVARFDGARLPFREGSFDASVVVDVLHHTADPRRVLAEARRVTTGPVVVKDHLAESARDRLTLSIMDWVGNRQFGVGRDGAYLSAAQWSEVFSTVNLEVDGLEPELDLYPAVVKPLFERRLHFVARLVAAT